MDAPMEFFQYIQNSIQPSSDAQDVKPLSLHTTKPIIIDSVILSENLSVDPESTTEAPSMGD